MSPGSSQSTAYPHGTRCAVLGDLQRSVFAIIMETTNNVLASRELVSSRYLFCHITRLLSLRTIAALIQLHQIRKASY